jgi:signal transduction histidine kinase
MRGLLASPVIEMLDSLRIAIERHKKLILIFLTAIFLPSVALSIFGVRSIRNERFRLVKQLEDEHRRGAAFLKQQIRSRFVDIENILQNLAQNPSFARRDYASIEELLNFHVRENRLIEHVFLVYKDEEPLFPLFLPISEKRPDTPMSPMTDAHGLTLEKAQKLEFSQKRIADAVESYKLILSRSQDRNTQAQMLFNIARCYMKLENYDRAIHSFSRVCAEYSQCRNSIDLYRNLLQKRWHLDADQFKTYASMVEKDISDFLSTELENHNGKDYGQEFERLKGIHWKINEQWPRVEDARRFILPELQRSFRQQGASVFRPFRHSQVIKHEEYLVLAVALRDEDGGGNPGLLGVIVNQDYLIDHEISSIVAETPFSLKASVAISTLSGQTLLGPGSMPAERYSVTEYFENNFPPWRIDIYPPGMDGLGYLKNFYFWTILTILVLLISGTVLVVRAIAHEMEILRLKSDFVSSVSHEFKTPIMAIQTLSERLQLGRVKSLDKRKEYYSIISKNADRLSSLVKNTLDFSKIEEGKSEYFFQETDVAQLLMYEIEQFKRDKIYAGIRIDSRISRNLPRLNLDRRAFSLVLNNLLENAVKFSTGSTEIYVNARKEAESVRVDVEDKGVGIASSDLDKIFDKFYQGKNATRQDAKGTGLGLALVKHTVEAHGGKVLVKSKVDQGSMFTIILPIGKQGGEV